MYGLFIERKNEKGQQPLNLFYSYNSNIDRSRQEGELPKVCRGLFPPYTKAYYSEQYNGRECSTHIYQQEEDLCWATLKECSIDKDLRRLNAGSTYYTQFLEIWANNRLVAIICGENYQSPDNHIAEHSQFGSRTHCTRSKLNKYELEILKEKGEKGLIEYFEEKMKIPSACSKEYIQKNYPEYIPRKIVTAYY